MKLRTYIKSLIQQGIQDNQKLFERARQAFPQDNPVWLRRKVKEYKYELTRGC